MSSMSTEFTKMTENSPENLTDTEQAFFLVLRFLCGNTSAQHTFDEYKNSQAFGAKL